MARMNFATIIASFTPLDTSFNSFKFEGQSTWDESEILSEPQLQKPRGRRFMDNLGQSGVTIHRYAKNGMRDLTLFDGDDSANKLQQLADNNPTIHFDLDFLYYLDEQDSTKRRIQRHLDCFIENQPIRAISNEVAIVRFTVNYGSLQNIDAATGQPVS